MTAEKPLLTQLEIYDLDEIAQLAGVSSSAIRACIRNGRLRATRIGRKWKVTRENAMAFLNGDTDVGGAVPKYERVEERTCRPAPSHLPAVQRPGPPTPAPPADSSAQLLFLKPDDLDRLVAALALHVERIERLSERRENELRRLVERLAQENESLRGEVRALRDEQRESVRAAAQRILDELNSAERQETDRFRFRWIQDQLTALVNDTESGPPVRRRWWKLRR